MSRRVLIVEPDAAGRAMMDRVLTTEGFGSETASSARDAQALLDGGRIELAVVDQLAGGREALDEVRWLRAKYPTVPVVVMGALLSRRVMQELLRLRVADALAKPFTPAELREAVARGIDQRTAQREDALEYAASLTDARRAVAAGALDHARGLLARAQATSPFDAEIMGLQALLAELSGRDSDADHGYRAALALRDEEACAAPDPHEGLARLAAYGDARPVPALRPGRAGQPLLVVSDAAELREPQATGAAGVSGPHVVVTSLGVGGGEKGAVFVRDGDGARAFLLLASSLRAESVAGALATLGPVGAGELYAAPATRERIDLARVRSLREGPPKPNGARSRDARTS